MYELKKIGKVFTSKFVGTGPSSYKKRIYRAAVSQRLRNTGAESILGNQIVFKLHNNFAPHFGNRKHNPHSATTSHTVQPVLAHSVPLQARWLAILTPHSNKIYTISPHVNVVGFLDPEDDSSTTFRYCQNQLSNYTSFRTHIIRIICEIFY